jgi:transposase
MQTNPSIIGVDVSKAELVAAREGEATARHIGNEVADIRAWLQQLPCGSVVAMEATGKYHLPLAKLAHAAGMRVFILNACDVYFYAKAIGCRGKTDRVDAFVIARYATEHHKKLHQWTPAAADHTRIDELLRRRALIVAKRDALRQTLAGLKDVTTAVKQLEQAFDDLLRTIEEKVQSLVAADPVLAPVQRRLAGVIGFGPVGSALLAVLLTRIPFANADALVAYSGMDPRPRDSGQMRGRRRISKRGPAYLRRQWFLAGFSASHSKALKPVYQALRAKGFATTEAFLILGRRLLRAAYAVWKTEKPFDVTKMLDGAVQP